MPVFGLRPEHVVIKTKGDTGTKLTVYANQADAVAQANPLETVTTDAGQWPTSDLPYDTVWVRTPAGDVYQVTDLAAKADKAAVDEALAAKADAQATTDALALKANASSLAAKADKTYVDDGLATKANASSLGAKADKTYVDTELGKKLDTATGNATYESGHDRIVYVDPAGNDSRSGKTWNTAKATITAALAEMGSDRGTIALAAGTHDVGAGVAWPATATCGMVGQGMGNTTLWASAQTGPVLDLTAADYHAIPNGLNDCEFGGFTLKGDGTAGAAKKGLAMNPTVSLVRGYFHDIAARDTGGAPFDLGYTELSDFDRLVAYEPVSAAANDIPYLTAAGAFNGNRINGLQLYGLSTGASVGVSGAVVIKDNGSTSPHDNIFAVPRPEFLHLPSGGTVFNFAGNGNVVADMQVFDCSKISGATGTSYVRLSVPAVMDIGGNLIRGVIPGKGTSATDIDMGVDVRQSRNRIEGTKGYKGTNVTLAAGVGYCHIHLGGASASASDPAVVDNSGVTTNSISDTYNAIVRRGATEFQQGSARVVQDQPGGGWNGGVRFYDPATQANGLVGLGTSGTRVQAIGADFYVTGDTITFRKLDLTANVTIKFGAGGPRWVIGTGTPEGVVAANVGSVFLRADGAAGSTFYVKESGTGNTGWVAK